MRAENTIRTLNELIRAGRDGEDFCSVCASGASAELAVLLRQRYEEWGRLSDELQALVLLLGGEPAIGGTLSARALHLWLLARTRLLGQDDALVLAEWERVERAAAQRYERAMSNYLPERIRRTVRLQAERIFTRLDEVARTRGRYIVHSPTG